MKSLQTSNLRGFPAAPKQRICAICSQPENGHANLGDWCPVFDDSGETLLGFSDEFKFQPREAEIGWRAGDSYTVFKYDSITVIGIVEAVSPSKVYGWELAVNLDGTLVSFTRGIYAFDEIVRMVPV